MQKLLYLGLKTGVSEKAHPLLSNLYDIERVCENVHGTFMLNIQEEKTNRSHSKNHFDKELISVGPAVSSNLSL